MSGPTRNSPMFRRVTLPPCMNLRRWDGYDFLPDPGYPGSGKHESRFKGKINEVNCPCCPNPVKPCLKKAGLYGDKLCKLQVTVETGSCA